MSICNSLSVIYKKGNTLIIKYIQFICVKSIGVVNFLYQRRSPWLLIKCQAYSSVILLCFNCLSYLRSRK
jgi:hypothetical protein